MCSFEILLEKNSIQNFRYFCKLFDGVYVRCLDKIGLVDMLLFRILNLLCLPKKTVIAVLDRLINPHWPYLPEETLKLGDMSDRVERAWSSVPEDPSHYDFLYHVLEADNQGRQPKIDEHTINETFNLDSVSCLRQIAESEDKVFVL